MKPKKIIGVGIMVFLLLISICIPFVLGLRVAIGVVIFILLCRSFAVADRLFVDYNITLGHDDNQQ